MEENRPGTVRQRTSLPRFVAITVGLAALAYVLGFVQQIKDIVAPVFLALNLLIVAYPLQSWLVRRIHRFVAAAITLVLILLVLVVFFSATGWATSELLRELPKYSAEFSDLWHASLAWLVGQGVSEAAIADPFKGVSAGSVMGFLTPVVANVGSILSVLATVVMAVFFLSMDSTSLGRRLGIAARTHPQLTSGVRSFTAGVRRYWVVTTVFGLIVALLDVVALAFIGVPLIWVWGVLAFLTNYIPNIGFVIGLLPPALLALLDGGPGPALVVIATYSVLNFSVQSIIQPKFTGESVGVTATVSFLSLLFWYWVLGWLGALLALPATLLVKALLIDADPRARWINAFISSNPGGDSSPAGTDGKGAGPAAPEKEHRTTADVPLPGA